MAMPVTRRWTAPDVRQLIQEDRAWPRYELLDGELLDGELLDGALLDGELLVTLVATEGSNATLRAVGMSGGGLLATRPPLVWPSTDASVAAVNQFGGISGVSRGAATISADAGSGLIARATVLVRESPVAYVNVLPSVVSLLRGASLSLSASPYASDGASLGARVVLWTSGSPSVASISGAGVVTAIAVGSTQIRATIGSVSGFAMLEVGNGSVTPAPSATSITPTAMAASVNSQTLTVFGANFQSGNIVQFKWGGEPGAGLWTTGSGNPPTIVNAGQLSIGMKPGAVSDVINVRVCRSASQTTSSDCSAGTQAVTVR